MCIHLQKPRRWGALRPWRRHSLVLLVAGLVYMGIGYSYLFAPKTESRSKALYYAEWWFPLHIWGIVWLVIGVMALISSRWPPASETWGYMALTGQASAWSAFYLFGVIFHDSPSLNLSGFGVWALVAFLWWAISGLVNPDGRKAISP